MPEHVRGPFLGQIVSALDTTAAHLSGALASPNLERPIPLAHLTSRAPKDEHRALYLGSSVSACAIMLQVDTGRRAVVLAHADDRLRPPGGVKVVGQRVWMEKVGRLGLA